MSSKDEIADILRDNIYYSPQVQGVVIHGAIEKLAAREDRAYSRGIMDVLMAILAITILGFIGQMIYFAPYQPTPEQQMEDTVIARGWPRDRIKF